MPILPESCTVWNVVVFSRI